MEKLNLVICGSRSITDEEKIFKVIDSVISEMNIASIITGGAKGIDAIGKEYAERKGIKHQEFPADWETYGKAAGPIRNKEMAIIGNATLAIVDDSSVGTWNMIENAVKWKHVNLTVYFFNRNLKMEFIEQIK
jgi:hypothetical protein